MSGTEAVRLNLENMIIAVSDVDHARGFYERLGWRFDDDVAPMDALRIVQFTRLGSGTGDTEDRLGFSVGQLNLNDEH
jgi:catechol 2,3-dioxygenase-like lactoylglutathione lyase family enzyme